MNVHKMRRAAQALTEDECVEVLLRGTGGVLALAGGPDEWPYAVPLSYAYRDGVITFHGAMEGHNTSSLRPTPTPPSASSMPTRSSRQTTPRATAASSASAPSRS